MDGRGVPEKKAMKQGKGGKSAKAKKKPGKEAIQQ